MHFSVLKINHVKNERKCKMMKNVKLMLIITAMLAGTVVFARPHDKHHHKRDGLDIANGIVDLVMRVIAPQPVVVAPPPPPVVAVPPPVVVVTPPPPVVAAPPPVVVTPPPPVVVVPQPVVAPPPPPQPKYLYPAPKPPRHDRHHAPGKNIPGPGNRHRR